MPMNLGPVLSELLRKNPGPYPMQTASELVKLGVEPRAAQDLFGYNPQSGWALGPDGSWTQAGAPGQQRPGYDSNQLTKLSGGTNTQWDDFRRANMSQSAEQLVKTQEMGRLQRQYFDYFGERPDASKAQTFEEWLRGTKNGTQPYSNAPDLGRRREPAREPSRWTANQKKSRLPLPRHSPGERWRPAGRSGCSAKRGCRFCRRRASGECCRMSWTSSKTWASRRIFPRARLTPDCAPPCRARGARGGSPSRLSTTPPCLDKLCLSFL